MIMPPGYQADLDEQVADALRAGTPNSCLSEEGFISEDKLLMVTCIHNRLDLAERLFVAGGTMTAQEFARVIWWGGDADKVAFLLKKGVLHNENCLVQAVWHGWWEAAFLFLDNGTDVQTPIPTNGDVPRMSLLHLAAWRGETEVALRLIERGALLDERDAEDMTPLMKACHAVPRRSLQPRRAVIRCLLEKGANPNIRNLAGETALLLCTGEPPVGKGERSYRTFVARMLLEYGADPNVVSLRGTTPLMFAARDNDIPLALSLLQAGAKLDTRTPDGMTALDVARKWNARKPERAQRGPTVEDLLLNPPDAATPGGNSRSAS
jgi:hypothetical protein